MGIPFCNFKSKRNKIPVSSEEKLNPNEEFPRC